MLIWDQKAGLKQTLVPKSADFARLIASKEAAARINASNAALRPELRAVPRSVMWRERPVHRMCFRSDFLHTASIFQVNL